MHPGGHSEVVNCCVFSPDGLKVASCSEDKTIKLWDVAGGTELCTLGGHSGAVSQVKFHLATTLQIASCGKDRLLMLHDSKGELRSAFVGMAPLSCFSLSRDCIVAGDEKGRVYFLRINASLLD